MMKGSLCVSIPASFPLRCENCETSLYQWFSTIFPPRGHLATSGDILVGWLPVVSRQVEARMLLNIQQCPGKLPIIKNYPAQQSIRSHRVGHDWSDLACMHTSVVLRLRTPVLYRLIKVPSGTESWMPTAITGSFRHSLLTYLPSLDPFPTPPPELPETISHVTAFTQILTTRSAAWGTQLKIIH